MKKFLACVLVGWCFSLYGGAMMPRPVRVGAQGRHEVNWLKLHALEGDLDSVRAELEGSNCSIIHIVSALQSLRHPNVVLNDKQLIINTLQAALFARAANV